MADTSVTKTTTATHTPGPWAFDDVRVYAPAFDTKVLVTLADGEQREHGNGLIALVYAPFQAALNAGNHFGEMHEANARLIAAAPDLLAALKDVLAIASANAEDLEAGMSDPACDAARAAIAKAEGRS